MKRTIFTLAAALIFGVAAAEQRTINYNDVPKAAKEFIAKHFAKQTVTSSMIDAEIMDTEYTVYLNNGAKVEFAKSGQWCEIYGGSDSVPASIIPPAINTYLGQKYPDVKISKIDLDRYDYELKLSNGLELKFDLKGNFVKIDD